MSTSIGVRGAHVTIGHGQVRETVGLPGTGLSYTHVTSKHETEFPADSPTVDELPQGKAWRGWVWIVIALTLMCVAAWKSLKD